MASSVYPLLYGPLPDSPPESEGSEPYSPPDGHRHLHIQDSKSSLANGMSGLSQVQSQVPAQPTPQQQHMYSPHHRQHPAPHTKGFTSYLSNEPPKLNHLPSSTQPSSAGLQQMPHHYIHPPILPPHYNTAGLPQQQAAPPQPQPKKRKHSDSPNNTVTGSMLSAMNGVLPNIKQEPPGYLPDCDDDYSSYDMGDSPGSFLDGTYQVIKWQAFQPTKWSNLCDENCKELPTPSYRVDADKGFNFSVPDEAFVCQKKNHFQVTVQMGIAGHPKYVKTQDGSIKKVDNYFLHFHGIKMESPSQLIKIEQSQSDRSKKAFYPVKVDLPADQFTKITVGRLHFSETTSNNMRKKGKPNPDQRYFRLVVSLHAHSGDQSWCIASHVSERIIVRASNPGQFEGDVDVLWQKGHTNDSVYHVGRVGVNTDHPDEAVTVHGNLKLTGHIIQPSDKRAKDDITEVDSKEQLRNVSQMRIYKYQYSEDFAVHAGLEEEDRGDTGVIAQEVLEVLPDAVRETGDIMLPNGSRIENFLVVNKDRIFMENVGAVKELCKLTDNLEIRIDELEKMNTKLAKLKRYDSLKSTVSTKSGSSMSTVRGTLSASGRKSNQKKAPATPQTREKNWCSNKFIQITIIALILIMAFCLVSITVLYILERHKAPSSAGSVKQTHNPIQTGHTLNPWPHSSTTTTRATPGGGTSPHDSIAGASSKSTSPSFSPTTKKQSYMPLPSGCVEGCENFCCPAPQEDQPGPDSRFAFPDANRTAAKSGPGPSVSPTYEVGTTQPMKVAVVTLPSDNHHPVVVVNNNPPYNVVGHINRNYLLRRRKRDENNVPVDIRFERLNYTVKCEACRDCQNNFTCHIPVSKTFNPEIEVTLQFSVEGHYTVSLCDHSSERACGTSRSDFINTPPDISDGAQQTTVAWKVRAGYNFRSQLRFRVSTSEQPCTALPGRSEPFLEYNLIFTRQPCDSHTS
ncbi:myelin regulatory factor-like isoform X2 [Liolophura sinensis]|uniref:myelin regulatory factor-like isoform X2 n=1 Tax=Liolophura sinensis TaxID=3198878 RepID=UPI00315982E0